MSVDTFDPGALHASMDRAAVDQVCEIARSFEGDTLSLTELQIKRFTPLVTHGDWAVRAQSCTDEELQGLIRIFTLGEMQFAGWKAGEKSAVIALVRELKKRGSYDKSLTQWIKSHTDNRFLPHGSLLDRL